MTNTDLTLHIDLKNPGQFYACCGLLEIASRLDRGTRAWFDGDDFHLQSPEGATAIFQRILASFVPGGELTIASAEDAEHFEPPVTPLVVTAPFTLRLDWWLRPDKENMPSRFKTWAGQMRVATIFGDLREGWGKLAARTDKPPFDLTTPLTGRFGFDPRASWNALDVGFSPNAQGISVETSPVVELLAAFGLARFRPANSDNDTLAYVAWSEPSGPSIAMLRAAECIPTGGRHFTFRIDSRGKYKSFSHANEKRSK